MGRRAPMRARIGGVTLDTVRDWALKLNAPGPDGLIHRSRRVSRRGSTTPTARRWQRRSNTDRSGGAWRRAVAVRHLCQWIWDEFQVSIARETLSPELRTMGYRKLSARPRHHAQAAGAIDLLKNRPRAPGRNRAGKGRRARRHRDLVRRRSQDRQKNKISRRWARRAIYSCRWRPRRRTKPLCTAVEVLARDCVQALRVEFFKMFDRAFTLRMMTRSNILKNSTRAPGRNRAQTGHRPQRDRGLVRRRGAHRAEEQNRPPLGQARQATIGARTDQRTESTYIFGAICPAEGTAAGLVLPLLQHRQR